MSGAALANNPLNKAPFASHAARPDKDQADRAPLVRSIFIDGLAKTAVTQADVHFVISHLYPQVKIHEISKLQKGGFLIKGNNLSGLLAPSDAVKWKECFMEVGKDIGEETIDIHLPGEGRRTLMSRFKNTIAFKRIPTIISDDLVVEQFVTICKSFDKNIDENYVQKSTSFVPKGQDKHKTVLLTLHDGNLLGRLTTTPINLVSPDGDLFYRTAQLWVERPAFYCKICFEADHRAPNCKKENPRCRWCLDWKDQNHMTDEMGLCTKSKSTHCWKCQADDHCPWQCKSRSEEEDKAFFHKKASYRDAVAKSIGKQSTKRAQMASVVKQNLNMEDTLCKFAKIFIELLVNSGIVDSKYKDALGELSKNALSLSVGTSTPTDIEEVKDESRIVVSANGIQTLNKRSLRDSASIRSPKKRALSQSKSEKTKAIRTPSDKSLRVCRHCGIRLKMQGIGTHETKCNGIEGMVYDIQGKLWKCMQPDCNLDFSSYEEANAHPHECSAVSMECNESN
jgi:hypothetical protein